MRYFKKVLLSNRLRFANVAPPKWEDIGDEEGIVAVDDGEPLLKELQAAVSRKIGGITEITEAEFTELKKKASAPGSPVKRNGLVEAPRLWRLGPRRQDTGAAAAVSIREPIQPLPPNPLPPADGPPLVHKAASQGPTVRKRTFVPMPSDHLKGISIFPTPASVS